MRIIGCGACMILGTPFPQEDSFFNQAVAHLKSHGMEDIDAKIVALGGFPAPRAAKHLKPKVLAKNPDILVLQFGSTDAAIPMRKLLGSSQPSGGSIWTAGKTSGWLDAANWRLKSLVSTLLLSPPLTAKEEYIAAIKQMVAEAKAAGAISIIISPFVFGSSRSNRNARRYTAELRKETAHETRIHLLDAHAELSLYPRAKVLCQDGFHLSRFGHEVIGRKLAALISAVGRASSPSAGYSI